MAKITVTYEEEVRKHPTRPEYAAGESLYRTRDDWQGVADKVVAPFAVARAKAMVEYIDTLRKVEEFEGYLIAPHSTRTGNPLAAWDLADRDNAEKGIGGLTEATSAQYAYKKIAQYASGPYGREYIAPLLALAHYYEQKDSQELTSRG